MNKRDSGKLGLIACIAILTGGCIGSAIFSLSGMTMIKAGAAAVITWIIAAVIYTCYGLLVTELAVRFPKSGGVFVFPARVLGNGWGFFSAWGYVISNIIAVAFSAITIGTFVCAGLSPVTQGAIWMYKDRIVLISALLAVVIVSVLNLMDVQSMGRINGILVIMLVVAMFIYIGFAVNSPGFSLSNYSDFFSGANGKTGWISAIPNAMVAYGACVAIAFMVGQVENPNRNVPKSLIISMIIVAVLYLLMVSSTLGIVNWRILSDEDGAFQPMFIAVNHMGYDAGISTFLYLVLGVAGVLSLITTMLVVQALNGRAIQSMADEKLIPSFLGRINRNAVPYMAVVISAAISAVLCFFSDFTTDMVNLGSVTAAVTMLIVMATYIVVQKKKMPENSYRAPGGVVLAVITMIVIFATYVPDIFFAEGGSTGMWIFTGIIYAIGTVTYLLCRKKSE